MGTDIVLGTDIVIDGCFGSGDAQRVAQQVFEKTSDEAFRTWIYVGSVATIAAAQQASQTAAGTASFRQLCGRIQWLAALAEDGQVWDTEDPIRAQTVQAVKRLIGATWVTNDPLSLRSSPHAVSAAEFLARTRPNLPLDFIDLKSQQDRIRPELERSIFGVLAHGQYIMGPEIKQLEDRLAEFVGVKHCVAVASGTDSLLIALMALKIGAGDEVITVPYTWISTAEVIALLGARTVFVDVEAATFNMNVDLLESAITARTKAIMPVSLYGQCPDMDRINAIAARHGIPVIEDAAQSFGATYHGRRSCALSLIGSTSFFPSKPLGCYGDGGALFTPDDRLADLFRQIRIHGQKKKHHHEVIGINGRLDTLQAAILLTKLPGFPGECETRARIAAGYTDRILRRRARWQASAEQATQWIAPPQVAPGNTSVFAQYTITSRFNDAIRDALQKQGIPSVTYYAVPLHLQPAFASLEYRLGDFPVAEAIAGRGLSLPMSTGLTDADQDRIVDVIFSTIDHEVQSS